MLAKVARGLNGQGQKVPPETRATDRVSLPEIQELFIMMRRFPRYTKLGIELL